MLAPSAENALFAFLIFELLRKLTEFDEAIHDGWIRNHLGNMSISNSPFSARPPLRPYLEQAVWEYSQW